MPGVPFTEIPAGTDPEVPGMSTGTVFHRNASGSRYAIVALHVLANRAMEATRKMSGPHKIPIYVVCSFTPLSDGPNN